MNLQKRVESIQHTLTQCANPVTLVAVSKTKPIADIQLAHEAGIVHFGENYLQEAMEKVNACSALNLAITWHYIGQVQSKKCHALARYFNWIQTLDRVDTAHKIATHALAYNRQLNVCIQVNISEDIHKGGISPHLEELCAFANDIRTLPALRLRGIMIMPHVDDKDAFARGQALFNEFKHTPQGHGCDTLSMGMTHDYQTALACGATMVRIGSGIFGARS